MVQVAFVAPDKTYPASHENLTKPELTEALLSIPFSGVDNSGQSCTEVVVVGGVGAGVDGGGREIERVLDHSGGGGVGGVGSS